MKITFLFKPLFVLSFAMAIVACNKNEGYYDFQNTENVYDSDSYQYLLSKPQSFDSLTKILQRLPNDFIDTLQQKDVTLFAPTNESIALAFITLNDSRKFSGKNPIYINTSNVDSLASMVSKYIVVGKHRTETMTYVDGMFYDTYFDRDTNTVHAQTVVQGSSGLIGGGPSVVYFSDTRGSDFIVDWIRTPTQSVNIMTTNGVIHILSNGHSFGFGEFSRKIDTEN